MWLKNLSKNKQKWNIKGEQQTCIWIVLSFYFFRPCWRGIHKLRRGMWLFPPPSLVLFTIFRVGFRAGFAFLGQGGRGLQHLGMFLGSAEFWGSISHPQGVLCTQQIPGAWHLAQVCRAGAQPRPAPRTGNSCFKKQRWEQPLGHLRNGEESHSLGYWSRWARATIPLLQIISSISIS